MTTINPMRPFGTSAVIVQSDINPEWTYVGAAGHYKTAQIRAAFGVPANAEVGGLRRDLRVAEAAADEWKVRAEKAEAERDEALDKLARIEARVDASPSRWIKQQYAEAILPFKLPTKAGAKFYATKNGHEELFETFTNGGQSCLYGGEAGIETPWSIMHNGWTRHRHEEGR